jgi:hypothetical protein
MSKRNPDILTIDGVQWIKIKKAIELLATNSRGMTRLISEGVLDCSEDGTRVPFKQVLDFRVSDANPNRDRCRAKLKTNVNARASGVGKMIETPAKRGAGAVSWPFRPDER